MRDNNLPALPEGDTLVSGQADVYYSFGPRVIREDGSAVPPTADEAPSIYGVYRYNNEYTQWNWIHDAPNAAAAREFINLKINAAPTTPSPDDTAGS